VRAAGGDEFEPILAEPGKQDEARRMLAETYSWFTKGFGTTDRQEATALLAELG
jgi:hypothetical protein